MCDSSRRKLGSPLGGESSSGLADERPMAGRGPRSRPLRGVEIPMPMPCWVLPFSTADGPANMALDEALLDAAAGGGPGAYLRCYGWTVPTLSLGYFQRL